MDKRTERQRSVGDAAGEHDLGPLVENGGDRASAQVRVGREHLVPHLAQSLPRVHVLEVMAAAAELAEPREQVVSLDHADLQPRDPELPCDPENLLAAGGRVEPAGVGHHLHAPFGNHGERTAQEGDEVGRVALVRVAQPLPHHDRERYLGQVVEAQVVERAAGKQLERGVDAVPPKTLPVADANHLAHGSPAPSV
jgi:hypothetical protein